MEMKGIGASRLRAACLPPASQEGAMPLGLRPTPVFAPSLWLVSKGGSGGKAPWGRLPPELHSDIAFMAEGPLEGPAGPRGKGPTLWGPWPSVATAIRRQGIRTHQAKGLRSPKRKQAFDKACG